MNTECLEISVTADAFVGRLSGVAASLKKKKRNIKKGHGGIRLERE